MRVNAELVFRDELESSGAKVYQTVTREVPQHGAFSGRITDKIRDGSMFADLGLTDTQFDKTRDRIMICGGPSFNNEIRDMLEEAGWMHGTIPREFVQERAFVKTIEA